MQKYTIFLCSFIILKIKKMFYLSIKSVLNKKNIIPEILLSLTLVAC